MKITDYTFDFSSLKEGQEFKSFTALFEWLTGNKPPTGSKNQAAVKKELSKYFEFHLKSEMIPDTKSKRAIIITKVYSEPLILEEKRGRHGIYADNIKPLLIHNAYTYPFDGKMYELINSIGIFQDYNKCCNTLSNPWKIKENMTPAQQQYTRVLWHQMRSTIERALSSLQDEGLIQWRYYHKILPDFFCEIEYTKEKRPKVLCDCTEEVKKKKDILKQVMRDPNSVLKRETLGALDIFSKSFCNEIDYHEYKDSIYCGSRGDPKEYPLRATDKQERAIENLELFMRQFVYMKEKKLDSLPAVSQVLNDFFFFSDNSLNRCYKELTKKMYPYLIHCKAIWKELEYEIIAEPTKLSSYFDVSNFDKSKYINALNRILFRYMDERMESIMFQPTMKTWDDVKFKGVYKKKPSACIGLEMPLNQSISACNMHQKLKELQKN